MSRLDGVVPLWVKCIARDIESIHFCVADLDSLGIGACINLAAHLQAGFCCRCGDQFGDSEAAGQRLAAPCLRDVAK